MCVWGWGVFSFDAERSKVSESVGSTGTSLTWQLPLSFLWPCCGCCQCSSGPRVAATVPVPRMCRDLSLTWADHHLRTRQEENGRGAVPHQEAASLPLGQQQQQQLLHPAAPAAQRRRQQQQPRQRCQQGRQQLAGPVPHHPGEVSGQGSLFTSKEIIVLAPNYKQYTNSTNTLKK